MKILISVESTYPWGFNACYYTSLSGWESVTYEMFKKMEYLFDSNRPFFAEMLFKEFGGCDEIIVCEDGHIAIYHIDEKNKAYKVAL